MATVTVNVLPAVASSSSQLAAMPCGGVSFSSCPSLARIPGTLRLSSRSSQCAKAARSRRNSRANFTVRAEYRRSGGGAGDFVAGFLLGGALFGTLGYLLAPTISKSILEAEKDIQEDEAEGPTKKLPQYVEDEDGLENTRKSLNEKIAQLNAAIDDVSAQLKADDGHFGMNESAVELESAA